MRILFFSAALFFSQSALAELTAEQKAALANTQELLGSQAQLSEFTKGNPKAAGALDEVKRLTNNDPKKQAEINQISSDIFKSMAQKSNGDDNAMMNQLQEGLRNPASFMQSLTPEQQARIKAMAAEIDAAKKP